MLWPEPEGCGGNAAFRVIMEDMKHAWVADVILLFWTGRGAENGCRGAFLTVRSPNRRVSDREVKPVFPHGQDRACPGCPGAGAGMTRVDHGRAAGGRCACQSRTAGSVPSPALRAFGHRPPEGLPSAPWPTGRAAGRPGHGPGPFPATSPRPHGPDAQVRVDRRKGLGDSFINGPRLPARPWCAMTGEGVRT